uniref:Receptor expression-enhancing protein n=1 Tax=Rodentolepis nana TaxID=102285 RepID=A0A0R3TJ79_RODNA
LTWFLETSNILRSEQAGLRPQRSTNQQEDTFSQHIKDALDARNTYKHIKDALDARNTLNDLVLWYFAYFMQMIWYYGIPGLLYADDLVLWYSAYFTQMIWYYGIPPPRKKAKERTESVLNCALKLGEDRKCPKLCT